MFSKRIERMLIFFDIFGYNSMSSKIFDHRKIVYIINAAHFSMAMIFTIYKIRFVLLALSRSPMIEALNSSMQYSVGLYMYWIIILDSNLYKQQHQQFWQILRIINKFYFRQNTINFTNYYLKCGICLLTSCLSSLIFLLTQDLSEGLNEVEFVYFFFIKFSEIRVFYYLFCLEVMQYQLERIENMLKCNKFDSHQFKWIRNYYHWIYEMSKCLNEIFGLSQVANVFFWFYFFLADLNWEYIYIWYREKNTAYSIGKYKFRIWTFWTLILEWKLKMKENLFSFNSMVHTSTFIDILFCWRHDTLFLHGIYIWELIWDCCIFKTNFISDKKNNFSTE